MGVTPRALESDCFPEIVGRSELMRSLLALVKKISPSDSSVLIQGESGTGKELIATAIHRLSNRSDRPFIALNCSAIPETLLESELFGHERGAFTGANRKREGYFAAADGGTIFLDEIGDMSLTLQAKLLRVLQDKRYTPLGGSSSKNTDVRIIAATNHNLENAMHSGGTFRLDLYYRLNVLPLNLPPLRERTADIDALLQHFLAIYNRSYAPPVPCYFHPDALACLKRYGWPGNIRQLRNTVDRLILTSSGGMIGVEQLPAEFHRQSDQLPQQLQTAAEETIQDIGDPDFCLSEHIARMENQLILRALRSTGNNKNRAAKILGLNRTTLVEKIKKRRLSLETP
ncbi:MAG: sigma 54-interacting transcriptional regulator [Pseudomonadota bacterium]|nr:sigma 54-interacting transcriptional regulator [Pseudomonadota bacterium]